MHVGVCVATVLITPPALIFWAHSVLFVILVSLFDTLYAAISAMEASDDGAVLEELGRLRKLLEEK